MWKGIALTLIAFLLLVLFFNLFNNPEGQEANPQMEVYLQYLEEQKEESAEYMQKAHVIVDQGLEINKKALENQKRFEKILDRWERQADRFDRILEGKS